MAKVKLTAGAEIDLLNKHEMIEALQHVQSWMAETAQGIRYSRFQASQIPTGNAVDFGGPEFQGDQLGPDPGFIWDVRRLRIVGCNNADIVTIFINGAENSMQLDDSRDNLHRTFYWAQQVVLYPGEQMRFVGTGLNASTAQITITGQVREIPITLAWKLGES
ncbi:MAG: hypothetical protein ACREQ5_01585 [Candidatus Dormibacteria bacterium]